MIRGTEKLAALVSLVAMSATAATAQVPSDQQLRGLENTASDKLYYSQPEQIAPQDINITRPTLSALVTIDRKLDPYQLDAGGSTPVSLKNVLDQVMERNLDLKISTLDVGVNKWNLYSSYGKFLPDGHMGYIWDYLKGNIRLPGLTAAAPNGTIHLDTPFIVTQAGVSYNAFRGGRVLFGALQNRNNYRASKLKKAATLKDALLEATRRYYNLILNDALLHIRIKAVETSRLQLANNIDLETNGFATHLTVLQAQTQLSADRQSLIEQQIARRKAAISLADYLDLDQGVDLRSVDSTIRPIRLISEDAIPNQLIATAIANRPELKQYEEQRLSAKKAIAIAAAPLYPQVQLTATEYGIGQTLGNDFNTVVTPSTTAPITLNSVSPTTGAPTTTLGTITTNPAVKSVPRQITGLGVIGVTMRWNIEGLGTVDLANVKSAKLQAREALLQSHKELNTVLDQVRSSYLDGLSAYRKLDETSARVASSAEELRLAQVRLDNGLGQNIDVLRAQQDYTNALIQHAQSTIDFNISQAQILHDLGVISPGSLLAPKPLELTP